MDKKEIRKSFLLIRNSINKKEQINKSNYIFNEIIKFSKYKESKIIACYYPINNEVDTKQIIEYSLNNNKKVVLPKIINNEKMEFILINNLNDLKENKFGIKEPKGNLFINKNEIDLIIIPLVAFDLNNNRIGYGKGYYDRFLLNYKGFKLGIAFKEQLLKKSWKIYDNFDIKLDKILYV